MHERQTIHLVPFLTRGKRLLNDSSMISIKRFATDLQVKGKSTDELQIDDSH